MSSVNASKPSGVQESDAQSSVPEPDTGQDTIPIDPGDESSMALILRRPIATSPAPAGAEAMAPGRSIDPAALFGAHHAAVFRAAYRITGQAEDAEDVLQTVFLKLIRNAEPAAIEHPRAYLQRAAVNAAINLLRQRRRHPASPLDLGAGVSRVADRSPDDAGDGAQPTAGPETMPDPGRTELRERLRAALAELPPRVAEIFALRYIEGFNNRQIAELYATSESSIGVTLHRARRSLRVALAPIVEP